MCAPVVLLVFVLLLFVLPRRHGRTRAVGELHRCRWMRAVPVTSLLFGSAVRVCSASTCTLSLAGFFSPSKKPRRQKQSLNADRVDVRETIG